MNVTLRDDEDALLVPASPPGSLAKGEGRMAVDNRTGWREEIALAPGFEPKTALYRVLLHSPRKESEIPGDPETKCKINCFENSLKAIWKCIIMGHV